ncbi:MAG: purine-nucleoside phosphorylase [Wolinella sp.]
MFVCAGAVESFAFAKPIGIGLIQSAIGLTRLILSENPDKIIFIGTAGSYDKSIPLLSIHESSVASQVELSYLEEDSYTPLDNLISLKSLLHVSHETNLKAVNSSNYITTNDELAHGFLKLGISLENMEFFSILEVARYFQIDTFGIFCVTNYTDKNAHKYFNKNHAMAMSLLKSYVKEHYAKHI